MHSAVKRARLVTQCTGAAIALPPRPTHLQLAADQERRRVGRRRGRRRDGEAQAPRSLQLAGCRHIRPCLGRGDGGGAGRQDDGVAPRQRRAAVAGEERLQRAARRELPLLVLVALRPRARAACRLAAVVDEKRRAAVHVEAQRRAGVAQEGGHGVVEGPVLGAGLAAALLGVGGGEKGGWAVLAHPLRRWGEGYAGGTGQGDPPAPSRTGSPRARRGQARRRGA